MGGVRAPVLSAVAAAVLVVAGCGGVEREGAAPDPSPAEGTTLLLFHPGGFVRNDGDPMTKAVEAATAQGFAPVVVDYPSADPAAALEAARAAADEHGGARPVFAYGESAGGTLAGRIAQDGLVDRAALHSPVADVERFADQSYPEEEWEEAFLGTEAEQRRVSLTGRDSEVPILALIAADDEFIPRASIREWAGADGDVEVRVVPGTHLGESGEYDANLRAAMRWLGREARGLGAGG